MLGFNVCIRFRIFKDLVSREGNEPLSNYCQFSSSPYLLNPEPLGFKGSRFLYAHGPGFSIVKNCTLARIRGPTVIEGIFLG